MFHCSAGSQLWWYATLRDSDTFATTMSPHWHLKKSAWYREMCPLIPLLNSLLIGGEIRSRVWGKSHIFSFLEKIKKIPLYSIHVALCWCRGQFLPQQQASFYPKNYLPVSLCSVAILIRSECAQYFTYKIVCQNIPIVTWHSKIWQRSTQNLCFSFI